MTVQEITVAIAHLPSFKDKSIDDIRKAVIYLMAAKVGGKLEALHQATGYERAFIHDRITWLNSNGLLLTGQVPRSYLLAYIPGGGNVIDQVLGSAPVNGAKPLPAPAKPTSGVPANLMEMSREEVNALYRARGIKGEYKNMSPDDRKIYNRMVYLRKHKPAKVAPKAAPVKAAVAKPQAATPEPPRIRLDQAIARIEAQIAGLQSDLETLKRAEEILRESA